MSNPITDAINKAVQASTTDSGTSAPDVQPVASSTLSTTSKSGK